LAIGLHDHVVVFYLPQGYAALVLVAYSLLLYLFAMAVLVADQQLQRLRQQDVQRLQAEHALHLRRQELERDFEDRQRQAGELARQRERGRISQDLHDGLGSQLTGLLRQVEANASSPAAVALEVRTAIEQMRLLVHNADHFEGDVAMLLAQVKEVVERRLRQAGVGLHWQVRLHHPERALAHAQAMALQHLVFELTTNTLKHAQATQVTVRVQDPPDTPAALFLSFADNGRGHPHMAGGAGSRSVQRRIDELGGRVVLAEGQHGMRLDCEFPDPLFLPDPATSTGPGAARGEPPQSGA
jgi:signal transduction histidine kinase